MPLTPGEKLGLALFFVAFILVAIFIAYVLKLSFRVVRQAEVMIVGTCVASIAVSMLMGHMHRAAVLFERECVSAVCRCRAVVGRRRRRPHMRHSVAAQQRAHFAAHLVSLAVNAQCD